MCGSANIVYINVRMHLHELSVKVQEEAKTEETGEAKTEETGDNGGEGRV